MKMISLFFVIFIESTKSYDPCTSKVYKLSYGSTDNLLVEAQINVIEHEDIWSYHLNTTLIGHNVTEKAIRKIRLKFQKRNQFFAYSCSKSQTGLTKATLWQNLYFRTGGSSIYVANKLICWWITDTRSSWPQLNGKPMDLINDCDYQISLISDETSALVASNGEDVPICRRKYTKCKKNYGNSNWSLAIKPNDYSISFYPQLRIDDPPAVTEVKLNSSDGTRISIICNHTHHNVFGYISRVKKSMGFY